ncbi:REP-associated tyrosine transposase [Lacimicrobium alkaliphilum]|uniref:Transposase IS200-like domain-containing protein n=1 Tax=Lacimicrobium alkaliphilum TaxID=1526571 RepID=A0A0U2PIB7_9ALTE|nr:transposase [Lacimicrobium alkaliphilum]ALS99245.1 hypothetical protein AT746_13925 [Lacimicrobium alkaliphilum]
MSFNALRKGRHTMEGGEYLITTTTQNRFPFFTDFYLTYQAVYAWLNATPDGCEWLCWVMMPDHFHGLLKLHHVPLGKVVKCCKGASARRVNQCINRNGRVWQPAYHDRALRAEEDRINIARYIVANPLRAGLVRKIGDYPFWDSVWL